MVGFAGGTPLNCPLMSAPDTPHHWLWRPASPSVDVMSGPGWQESWPEEAPLYNRSPPPSHCLSISPFVWLLYNCLVFSSSTYLCFMSVFFYPSVLKFSFCSSCHSHVSSLADSPWWGLAQIPAHHHVPLPHVYVCFLLQHLRLGSKTALALVNQRSNI